MRFGVVHQVMTSILAATGIFSVVASGELSRWTNVSLVLGLVVALAIPEAWHSLPWLNRATNVLQVGLLAVQIVRCWFFNRPLLEVAVEFAAALQIVRLATRRGAVHDQQVIILALIHLIAGTVLGSGLGYGLCFLGFLIVAPGALMLSHLRREVEGNYRQGARDRTGLPVDVPRILRSRRVVGRTFVLLTCALSIPILLFTSVLFLFFPRVGLSLLHLTHSSKSRLIGFNDRVDLGGGVGELRDNQTIALYVTLPDLPEPPPERIALHLRGTAFDTFDGKAWSRSSPEFKPTYRQNNQIVLERPPEPGRDRLFKFDLDYYDPPMVFLPQNTVTISARSRAETSPSGSQLRIERGSEGQLRYRSPDERGLHYEAWISPGPLPAQPLSRDDRARYLTLPPLAPRIADLARQWTAEKNTPFERAKAIETHLRADYRYDLATPAGAAPSPLDHFLFESRRGYCEYYASAMAIMLRQVGIPSRNVTGYVGGQFNRFSRNYIVRQREAHAWVEAYIDDAGWVLFDPTPPAFASPKNEHGFWALLRDVIEASGQRWDRDIVHYDIQRQLSMLERAMAAFDRVQSSPTLAALSLPRSAPLRWALLLVPFALVAGAWALLRRLRRPSPLSPTNQGPGTSRAAAVAVLLYEQLEAAMNAQGLGRPQGVPPLRHAQATTMQKHPLGPEILELTQLYLDARFGHAELSEEQRKVIERRIKAVRSYTPQGAQG